MGSLYAAAAATKNAATTATPSKDNRLCRNSYTQASVNGGLPVFLDRGDEHPAVMTADGRGHRNKGNLGQQKSAPRS